MNNNTKWSDDKEYFDALEEYLAGAKNTSYYEGIRNCHLDISRFFGWIGYIKEFKEIENLTILDIGCGSGGMMIALSTLGAKVSGIEVDRGLFSLGKIRLKKINNAQIILTDGKKIPFPDNYFDAITCIHVIEHVEQTIDEFLREVYRVLKPGGLVLLDCPNRLYPIEPHNRIPLVTYLPKKQADSLCLYLSKKDFLNKDLQLRLKNVTTFNHFISYFFLEQKLKSLEVEIVKTTPLERFLGGNPFIKKIIPSRILKFLALLFAKDISILFRKKKLL